MNPLPRAILFDLDDTILSAYGQPHLAWARIADEFAAVLAPMEAAKVAETITAHAREFWSDAERHKEWRGRGLPAARQHIVAGAFEELSALYRCSSPEPATLDALVHRFTTFREEEMHLFPGALETLDRLRALGVRLGLVTNGRAEGQRAKLTRFDLAHRFDHIQIEGEHGFGKPEERAYTHALAALGVAAHETWMVGDNLEWEVVAPQTPRHSRDLV